MSLILDQIFPHIVFLPGFLDYYFFLYVFLDHKTPKKSGPPPFLGRPDPYPSV